MRPGPGPCLPPFAYPAHRAGHVTHRARHVAGSGSDVAMKTLLSGRALIRKGARGRPVCSEQLGVKLIYSA